MSKKLFIAEKPDMGANIAKNLPGPHKRGDGFIQTGGGIVTWAIGHILEQCPPEAYDDKYKKWNYGDLPIIPMQWKLQVSPSKKKQFFVIKNLLKQCSEVINAGDPGREGQLIVDEILYFAGNKKPVKRLLLNSLDATSVKKALASMEDNNKYKNLYDAAIGRQRADWTVGMNLTRAYTILGKNSGYDGVLSVGRVQTPTLAIVVRREDEINNFVPKKYFNLSCQIGSSPSFIAKYLPPEKYTKDDGDRVDWLDDNFRVCSQEHAKKIISDVSKGVMAKVVDYTNKHAEEKPPMPFELSDIQSRMNAKCGASVGETLQACQSLYEKGYASYPRTDCAYLPPSQHGDSPNIFKAIASAMPNLSPLISKADPNLMSRAWNEKKLGEHHAIIPTGTAPDFSKLTELEKMVYDAISRRYLAQFFPDCEVDKANVELEAGGHRWGAKGRVIKKAGWREIYGQDSEDEDGDGSEGDKKEENDDVALPALTKGDEHLVVDNKMEEKYTNPPSRYTQGTLLQAMKFVDKLVSDPQEKKMLKNVQGIGRAATRPGIIETLIKRRFLLTQKKQLYPSDTAKMLIKTINKDLTDPGLTARWEHVLDGVAAGKIPLQAFTQKQEQWVKNLVSSIQGTTLNIPSGANVGGGKKEFKKKEPAKITDKKCSQCGKPMAERVVGKGPKKGTKFLGCTGFPNCKHSEWPK